MTRFAPSSYHARAETWLATLTCVETCRWHRGAYRPARVKVPRSAVISASTPASSRNSSHSGSWSISPQRGMVFTVTWTRTPRLWANPTARGSSSREKFPAKERIPKLSPARYTASAP